MSIEAIRFRTSDGAVLLQVLERKERNQYMGYDEGPTWRDAKVEDLLSVAKFVITGEDMEWRMRNVESALARIENERPIP